MEVDFACYCGSVRGAASGVTHVNVVCNKCPAFEFWWFRLDEWCHRHLPRWMHRTLCKYVEGRLWGPVTSNVDGRER